MKPMLAHNFKKRSHNIAYPAYTQPKMNGVRCLATKAAPGVFDFASRNGKPYTGLDHIASELDGIMATGETFDGELFSPDLSLQEIVAAVNTSGSTSVNTPNLEFWVYDVVCDGTFGERLARYKHAIGEGSKVIPVETVSVASADDVTRMHRTYTSRGFEGTIIRNLYSQYKHGRSADLQKFKEFLDAEFKIVGATEGTGAATGTVVWTCEIDSGATFGVVPMGTVEERRGWWQDRESNIGSMLTVRYQFLSARGIPNIVTGLAIRNYEG